MSALVKSKPTQIDALLETLGVGARDEVKLHIRQGVAKAVIKRINGEVQTATAMLGGRFQQRTSLDTVGLTPMARRKAVRELHKQGHTQTTIADMLGVSQATVSLDLRK